jgi:hypothetical protein
MTEALVRNKPRMANVKDMPLLQDGPPSGGFAPERYARRIPTAGPSLGHLPHHLWRLLLGDVPGWKEEQGPPVS